MKYISLILLFLMPLLAPAQVTTSLQDGGLFYVVVEGDTVSQHTRVDKAIESASNYRDWEIVQDFRLSGSSLFYGEDIIIEEVTDTIYADTVYVNLPPHDNSFLHSVDWTHEVDRETGEERIDFVIKTDEVDSLIIEVRCGNEWVKETVFPDVENDVARPANTLSYGILWDCDSDLIYDFRAHKGVWEQAITERFPGFAFELTESEQAWVDSVKKKTESDMTGSGTELDPLQVSTPQDLFDVRLDFDLHYLQVNPIDMTFDTQDPAGLFYNDGAGWDSLGPSSATGSFDGGGHPITGLYMNRPGEDRGGLFGQSSGEDTNTENQLFIAKNINLVEPDITAGQRTGAIVGSPSRGFALRTSKVFGGTVTGTSLVGGAIGTMTASGSSGCRINDVYAEGMVVNGDNNVGAFASIRENRCEFYNGWTNNVVNNGSASGFIKYNFRGDESIVEGGFWDIDVSGISTSDNGTGLTTPQAYDINTYINAGWDIVHINNHDGQESTATWYIDDGNDYPRLWWEYEAPPQQDIQGDASIIETAELTDLSGDLLLSGDSAIHDEPEVAQSTVTILINGSGSVFDLMDQVDSAGAVLIESTATVEDSPEQIQITGAFEDVVNASAQIMEMAEEVGGSASVVISGSGQVDENSEAAQAHSEIIISSAADLTDHPEAVDGQMVLLISSSGSITDLQDDMNAQLTVSLSGSAELFGIPEQLQAFATFEDIITAAAQIVEHAEVMGGNASIMISGNAEAHELPENVVIDSSLYLSSGAAMDEDPEAISVLSKIAIDMAASITEKPEQLLAVETVISDRVKIRVTGQKVGNTIFITGERVPTKLTIN